MNFRGTAAAALIAAITPGGGLLAQSIADRAGRLPPELASLVTELGTAALSRGLPADPLIQKAIEGNAKGIASERVAIAVRIVAQQLDTAGAALRAAHPAAADTSAIAAGAFALTAGLNGRQLGVIAQAAREARSADLSVALRVTATLAALGVPAPESVQLVTTTLRSGRSPSELLSLPGRVQGEMSRGATPAQAAAGLARAAAAQGRRGPPAEHGPPPDRGRPRP